MKTKYKSILALSIVLIFSVSTLTGQASGQETAIGIPERTTTNQPGQPMLVWERMDVAILPSPRFGFAMTYNPINQVALVFGGYATTPSYDVLNDLWLTNGRQWLEYYTPHAPGGRSGASMAYDMGRQSAVLFGGVNAISQTLFNDTWIFNGVDWTEQLPQKSPSPRLDAEMIYDPVRKKIYLFGGWFNYENTFRTLGDMWSWDGTDWQQLLPSVLPSSRAGALMVFDPVHQNILLFGGNADSAPLNDTWIWDGETWNELHPLHHPLYPFYVSGMSFDEGRQQVILVGSSNVPPGNVYRFQTWTWDGQDWTELETFQGLPNHLASYGGLFYFPDLQSIVYFSHYFMKSDDPATYIERFDVWALASRYLSFLPRITQ